MIFRPRNPVGSNRNYDFIISAELYNTRGNPGRRPGDLLKEECLASMGRFQNQTIPDPGPYRKNMAIPLSGLEASMDPPALLCWSCADHASLASWIQNTKRNKLVAKFWIERKSFSRATECHFSLIFRYFVKLRQGKDFFHIKNNLTLTRRGYPYNELIGHLNG